LLLGGLQKTTLIDFPGKVACTVFTVGCNFGCPFCHNRDLVNPNLFRESGLKQLKEAEFFAFLKERKKLLDGVCITGGEPTVQPDLPEFTQKIKKIGYLVKLDTNGSNPQILKKLIDDRLIDYVAMDIKSDFDSYLWTIKLKAQNSKRKATTQDLKILDKIKESIRLILQSGINYEFRTTVVPTLHTEESLIRLAKQLKTLITNYKLLITDFVWFLQPFRPQNCLDKKFLQIKPYSNKEMKKLTQALKTVLPATKLRGEG